MVMLGDSVFLANLSESAAFAAIVVEDQVMVGFQVIDEHLLFSLELHDDQGQQVLAVVRNELLAVTSQWDMTFVGTTLTMRLAPRKLLVEIDFATPNGMWLRRGRFLRDGIEVLVSPSRLVVGGVSITGFMAHNNRVSAGIVVGGSAPISGVVRIAPGSRDLESDDPERDSWLSEVFPE